MNEPDARTYFIVLGWVAGLLLLTIWIMTRKDDQP
jgi:hypothetical protein